MGTNQIRRRWTGWAKLPLPPGGEGTWGLLCGLALLSPLFREATAAEGTGPLTNIAAIKALSLEEMRTPTPVRVLGVITAINPRFDDAFIQNPSGGIYLAAEKLLRGVQVGDLTEVEGVADPGGFAPIILPRRVTRIGQAELPAPIAITMDGLADGRFDSERVVIEAKVLGITSVGQDLRLNILKPEGQAIALLVNWSRNDLPARLMGATVRLTGISAPAHNDQRQATTARMLVTDRDAVVMVRPGPEDPDNLPRDPIGELLRFKPGRGQADHVRIRGVVTAVPSSESFFLQDESGSTMVWLGQAESAGVRASQIGIAGIEPGNRLEVTGGPFVERLSVAFRAVAVKRLDRTALPPAVPVIPETLNHSSNNWRRVSVEGRVLSPSHAGRYGRSELSLMVGQAVVVVQVSLGGSRPPRAAEGSLVRVEGVADIRGHAGQDLQGTVIHMADVGDLTVIAGPPADPVRLLLLGGSGVSVVGGLAFAWAFLLRRKVQQRTAALAQANTNLRAGERLQRLILDNIPDPAWLKDASNRLAAVNQAWCKYMGRSSESVVGKLESELFSPEALARWGPLEAQVLATGQPGRWEDEMPDDQGRVRVFDTSVCPLLDAGGRVTATVGIARDITSRKQTVRALLQSQERLQLAQEAAKAGAWEWNLRTNENFWAEELWQLYGVVPHSRPVCYQTWRDAIHPDDRARTEQAVQEAARDGGEINVEYRTIRPDGGERWLLSRGRPFHDASGQVKRYVGIVMDITDRKQLEENLQRLNRELENRVAERTAQLSAEVAERRSREAELRNLWLAVEQSPVTVMITDPEARIEYVNPQFERDTGYTAAEVAGRNPRLLKSGVNGPEFYAAMWQRLRAGLPWQGEMCNRRKDGSLRWELVSIAPVRAPEGRTTHYVAIKEDITERRHIAESLRQAKENAEAANRAKSVFLANMSHEIRTPMNAVLGFTQLLLREPGNSPRQRQQLTSIMRSGEHLLQIINDILEMARIESGRLKLSPVRFDLTGMLGDLQAMFAQRAQERGIVFTVDFPPGLPAAITADATKLRQVLINLLGNAFKFTPTGGCVALRFQAIPVAAGEVRLEAEVTDSGSGIASEDVDRLFDPFFQSPEGRAAGGTGLGLTISRQFARLMGGDITVRSTPGVGSRFRFHSLAQPAESHDLPRTSLPAQAWRLSPSWMGCRVLVADDIGDNREVMASMLATAGFDVRHAENGRDAVEQCAVWRPRLVMLDLRMPVMDGFEAARQLRAAHGGEVSIIASSASVFPEIRDQALAAGANAFLAKPFAEDELFRILTEVAGVRFVDAADGAEELPAAADAALEACSVEALHRLPESLLQDLRQALVEADHHRIESLAARIRTLDDALGRQIQRLNEFYDYEPLHELLSRDPGQQRG